ncbi:hypothetical protein Tsubulata_025278 [Turnera subulata]|uniref:Uncharacterized protein n=1 Tax=Turnera subulata TaxID=218843 RepID=A0A9Q0JCX3_9ROSI|nr:hypothetical protein Tsubulata_025278 [Turnera subulata]
MERDSIRSITNNGNSNHTHRTGSDGLLLRTSSETTSTRQQTTPDFVLQWGNRKRLRCMKVQVKDDSTAPVHRTTVRVDRRVVRADKEAAATATTTTHNNQPSTTNNTNTNHSNGYFNLRQRPSSPQQPTSHRVLRYIYIYIFIYAHTLLSCS